MAGDAPNIEAVQAEKGRAVAITWKGGADSLVDLAEHLAKYRTLAPLRADLALFRRVAVGDWGWSLHWSDDLEISADTLWRLALEQGNA
jgi:hypothetical protein